MISGIFDSPLQDFLLQFLVYFLVYIEMNDAIFPGSCRCCFAFYMLIWLFVWCAHRIAGY
ncbi:MAG: hypothetical protein EBZ24_11660 [Synechococcaceae bacterium WB9_4xB_025]|nr:hypothetical protein [Synechococcaceae bacterium WB9_4xB_025]